MGISNGKNKELYAGIYSVEVCNTILQIKVYTLLTPTIYNFVKF